MSPRERELEIQFQNSLDDLRQELEQKLPKTNNTTNLNVDELVSSTDLDKTLLKYVMIYEATPKGLAKSCIQDPEQEAWIHKLLLNQQQTDDDVLLTSLLRDMIVADGPRGNEYGTAMHLYHTIIETSEQLPENDPTGILRKLALAISLEHATPVPQENPKRTTGGDDNNEQTFVDPVRRYLNYEMAYLQGELDPNFELLSVWELRFVVDGSEPDEVSQWGRDMLRNYRPDHILTGNEKWRYVEMVRSNIRYGSASVKYDRDDLQLYQNILLNGGICGRRAFFGRFILRAFGIPTTARPSKGHGALCHWTPYQKDGTGGWCVNLGPEWGAGYTKTRYKPDLDFLATTQARVDQAKYVKVKRAQWIGSVFQEKPYYGEKQVEQDNKPNLGFWYKTSLQIQKQIIDGLPTTIQSQRVNKKVHKPTMAEQLQAKKIPVDTPKQILYGTPDDPNAILVPAATFCQPKKSTRDVQIMRSFHPIDGGWQVYLPSFPSQGLTIVRGGTWKMDPADCSSGARLKSGGYGKYADWGMRVALSGPDDGSVPSQRELSIDLDAVHGTVKLEMVFVPPGSFLMGGDPNKKDGRFECVESPKHKVTLTCGFWMGKYPVTQEQYEILMGTNPSKSTKDPKCPVDTIGESEAFDYCDKMVEVIGRDFRLPTEAEWEYAARGGMGDTKWFFGDNPQQLGEYAWFKDNSGGKSHPVGQKKPNPFGLYDKYGNVFERVSDKYSVDYYQKSPSVDPTGPSQGTKSIFEYKVTVPTSRVYKLEAEVVTANPKQHLKVIVNGDESNEYCLDLPWTNGYWEDATSPCNLPLQAGENTIRFWRDNPPQYGVSVKSFTLTPCS
ncbi:sulfatase-modifying factor [Nitzschia inconspicua]|uniref:Sulfatase-modifying factor n=1 Tax=Nitzschia inconspicua TaxID=303405 RepID=A0A9K3M641_9STRA|nr:sulfatase-modifying factor [Nitzschia inconspicua]